MNAGSDHDGKKTTIRVVRDGGGQPPLVMPTIPPDPPERKRSKAAEAARRYRAHQRGENVAKRKPGPKPHTNTDLRNQVRELNDTIKQLQDKNKQQELLLRIAQERLARQTDTLTIDQVATELITLLRNNPPRKDPLASQDLLQDLVIEIKNRHEQWQQP